MRSARAANPRRVPAVDSVCIKKPSSIMSSCNASVVSNLAADGAEAGSYYGRQHSPAAESAKTWFDDSNKNVVSSERGSKFYAGKWECATALALVGNGSIS